MFNRGLDGFMCSHIFSFFHPNELSNAVQVNTNWNNFFKNDFNNTDKQKNAIIEKYLPYTHFYGNQKGHLLYLNVEPFFEGTNRKIYDELPFTRKCINAAIGSLIHKFMCFWSPDGSNFYLMHANHICKDKTALKISHLGNKSNCKIIYKARQADVYESSDSNESDSDATDEESSNDDLSNQIIATFKRCDKLSTRMLLAGILCNRYKIIAVGKEDELKPSPLDMLLKNNIQLCRLT